MRYECLEASGRLPSEGKSGYKLIGILEPSQISSAGDLRSVIHEGHLEEL